MKKWYWMVLAILCYLVFLLAYMPAIYITDYLQKSTTNTLSFEEVSGTIFNGSANALNYKATRLHSVKWETSPWSLLLLKAKVDFAAGSIRNTEQIYAKGQVSVPFLNPNKITASNTTVFVPAKPLFAQIKLPVEITATGRFKVDLQTFFFDQGCAELEGKGNWLQAAVNINKNPIDFGTFDAVLSCETPNFAMQISPENGLSLDAKIIFDTSGKYGAQGTFKIPNNFPQEIKQGAMFFGSANAQGVYQLNIPFK